ncbi:aminotransferase class V-fold PLP-dependent enzyme [Dermatobacter hominis]|uniref:aminotransferase class V-fold PLP-dependent enzyme n=1 Tax=Dermatobacter hominis TaxID=2884263 RepID=UPI001D129AC6|nr:aminotransferase class V-fold PLP-dependent enzyme [Dermatobacter hominis]UDY35388.1 aminotransferase class V-fold PLP-dependent enzyme [Dermatobacter hominis]
MSGPGIDVGRVRADTPATSERVLLNHAGASPSPEPVLDVVVGHLREEARLGGYEAAAARADDVERARRSVADLVGGRPDEVAFATSATDAWESAFWSFPWSEGDVVLTCRSEYVTNVLNLLVARDRFGVRFRVVDDDEFGQIDVEALGRHLEDPSVRMVALSHVPTQGGLVNPAEEVGRRCREAGVTFLLDACQSAGQLPLDVAALGCDLLTATGRKYLRAPRGTGFLWARADLADRLAPLGSAGAEWTGPTTSRLPGGAARFERFERSVAGLLGLGAAVDYALDLGLAAIGDRVGSLAEHLRAGLSALPGVAVHDRGVRRCGIVTFTVDGVAPAEVRRALAADAVQVWTTSASFARIDLGERGIDEMVRASVHYLNTTEELDRTVDLVGRLAGASR